MYTPSNFELQLMALKDNAKSLAEEGYNTAQKILNMASGDRHEAYAVSSDMAIRHTHNPIEYITTFFFKDGSSTVFGEYSVLEGD